MNTFVDLVFAETNEGYINSDIPVSFTMEDEKELIIFLKVRVSKLGPKLHPTLNDIEDSITMLREFESSLP